MENAIIKQKEPLYKSLYFQVIVAIIIGVLVGYFAPYTGEQMKPLGDGFIKLIKMMIAPIIFCTVVVGIAGMEDMKKIGKTGGYAGYLSLLPADVQTAKFARPTPSKSIRLK